MSNYGPFNPDWVSAIFPEIANDSGRSYRVEIYAIGGSTIGRTYQSNNWGYRVVDNATKQEWSGTDFYSGTAKTHEEAALTVADMIDWNRGEKE